MRLTSVFLILTLCSFGFAEDDDAITTTPGSLPIKTSPYNRGDFPGRFRDDKKHIKLFELKSETPLYDGAAREFGHVTDPVMLNEGAAKDLNIEGKGPQPCLWAWHTKAGSGWIPRSAIIAPPTNHIDPTRNPKPALESPDHLTIDAASGTQKLAGLRHTNSKGEIPKGGGNKGEHYAGRNPGSQDFVYLLFACPNVQRGGMAKDSIPDGAKFIPALDANSHPIVEKMTMYQDGDLHKRIPVIFIYGREEGSSLYGWIARANVGER